MKTALRFKFCDGYYRAPEVVHVAHRGPEVNKRNDMIRVYIDGALEARDGIDDVVSAHVHIALEEEGVGGWLRGDGAQDLDA